MQEHHLLTSLTLAEEESIIGGSWWTKVRNTFERIVFPPLGAAIGFALGGGPIGRAIGGAIGKALVARGGRH